MKSIDALATTPKANPIHPSPGSTTVSTTPGASFDLSFLDNTTLIARGNNDQISLVSGLFNGSEGYDDTVVVGGNHSLVLVGDAGSGIGNDISLTGSADTVSGSPFPGSYDRIHVEGSNAVVTVGGYNTVTLDSTGANVTILPTQVADSFDPFGNNVVRANGTGHETVTGGGRSFSFTGTSGQYSVSGGSAENATISGGTGGGVFTGGYFFNPGVTMPQGGYYVGNNTIIAGTGHSTLVGALHGSSVLFAEGSAKDVLIAGEYGNDTLSGANSTANNLFEGFTGAYSPTNDPAVPSVVIQAGIGNDTLVAGVAAETLTGGAGSDVFRFIAEQQASLPTGGNTTLITDFTPGADKLDLQGFGVTAAQLVASETISGGSTQFALPGGVQITLANLAGLTVKDFSHG